MHVIYDLTLQVIKNAEQNIGFDSVVIAMPYYYFQNHDELVEIICSCLLVGNVNVW